MNYVDLTEYKSIIVKNARNYWEHFRAYGTHSDEAVVHGARGAAEAGAIMACLSNGVIARSELVDAAARMCGSSRRMVRIILEEYCGRDVSQHFWFEQRIAPGVYHYKLLDRASPVSVKLFEDELFS